MNPPREGAPITTPPAGCESRTYEIHMRHRRENDLLSEAYTWGPFTDRAAAEQTLVALASRSNVVSARIVELP